MKALPTGYIACWLTLLLRIMAVTFLAAGSTAQEGLTFSPNFFDVKGMSMVNARVLGCYHLYSILSYVLRSARLVILYVVLC